MTPAEKHYQANKDKPEFKARRRAAVKRYDKAQREAAAAREDATVQPVVGERFDDWLRRWAESEGRALFAARAAAMHERLTREFDTRKRKSLEAINRVRAGNADAPSQRTVSSWRQPGTFLAGPSAVASVFALGGMGACPHGSEAEAEPVLAPTRRHLGVVDAAAVVRRPQRSNAP